MRNGTITFSSAAIARFSGSNLQGNLRSQPSFHVIKAMCQASEIIPRNAIIGMQENGKCPRQHFLKCTTHTCIKRQTAYIPLKTAKRRAHRKSSEVSIPAAENVER